MVFKRRDRRTWLQRIGDAIYPRGGWLRAASYVWHRLRRLPDPPHKIARGVAVGIFVSFTPFFGFHFLLAAGLALLVQGNVLAALLATFVGNPLTFPLIATLSLEVGNAILNLPGGMPLPHVVSAFSHASVELWSNFTAIFDERTAHWDNLAEFWHTVFVPYAVGGILPGLFFGMLGYWLTLPAVTAYQKRRARKLRDRHARRRAEALAQGAIHRERQGAAAGRE
ncbi:hypothetical protein SAMN05216257_101303 [Meinhardsimonia xiamenensis]|jgi:uncharacterized protein (DUF2062 family)|uniref:DUF2062 domain-containing protein n=1 Tax=Meinhardsimonia xiamenensis TaxID=990712 RepID=A0A1G8YF87_9RHOB|nr:DUF2062 domain-containing protein [Meinhardsimonia xiamenensis]PRX37282.1 hypothetical protein LV81_01059 [Meinhardsimonia xiamenensis]SDK01498.1 hypothetical protein SAMN05216257_101303 [Meinhardsimonia xiamenensis]